MPDPEQKLYVEILRSFDDYISRKCPGLISRQLVATSNGVEKLLITNDGELAHRLLAPKKHVDKLYYAKVEGVVTKEDVKEFEEGVNIGEDEVTRPAVLEILKSDEISEIHLTIQEGKFHQVKRMFEAVGKKVIYLKRISMGTLQLDENLQLGEYRMLTEEELKHLC